MTGERNDSHGKHLDGQPAERKELAGSATPPAMKPPSEGNENGRGPAEHQVLEQDALQALALQRELPSHEASCQDRNCGECCDCQVVVGSGGKGGLLFAEGKNVKEHAYHIERD